MRTGAIFIFLIVFISCSSNSGQKSATKKKPQIDTISFDSTLFMKNFNVTGIELLLKPYLDSLEIVNDASQLPSFLYDSQFDYKHPGIWPSLHSPISLRAQVINRINKCKVLRLIVNSDNILVHKVPTLENNMLVPNANMSFSDLAKRRMEDLECDNLGRPEE